ncbi:MAG: class I SAM-dependent RNA methyltransferase [Acetobacteraceae bacterium]|nr:class I SAM-dependent RNA methyltransferase [Acetobacteraceae bacterium]
MRRPAYPPSETQDVRIERIGADGDGIASAADGTPIYIPYTLPGERVLARVRGRRGVAEAIVAPSPVRVMPPCAHFGTCGGCALQHWHEDEYRAWKVSLLEGALRRAGFADPALRPVVRSERGSRRRIVLAITRTDGAVRLGLHRARSAEITEITGCTVLHPAIEALIAPLEAVLSRARFLRRHGAAVINLLDDGPDLLLSTDDEPDAADRVALTGLARTHGIVRIAWARGKGVPEPVCTLRRPVITLGGVKVISPPGAFLQASSDGERAIVAASLEGLPERLAARGRIVELYAGCGTLTFPLAQRARILAYEAEATAVEALQAAVDANGLAGRIVVNRRDLVRQPLTTKELANAAAVVLDPPYAGAALQMAALAAAGPRRIIYVSCNPAALARDARLLGESGYRLVAATPIDQFLFSARLESVSVFGRD